MAVAFAMKGAATIFFLCLVDLVMKSFYVVRIPSAPAPLPRVVVPMQPDTVEGHRQFGRAVGAGDAAAAARYSSPHATKGAAFLIASTVSQNLNVSFT